MGMVSRHQALMDDILHAAKLFLHKKYYSALMDFVPTLIEKEFDVPTEMFEELIFFCEDKGIPFIWRLDWKTEIADLEDAINVSLKENFATEVAIPSAKLFNPNDTISSENVLKKYDAALQQRDFRLGLVFNDTDSYWLFICQSEKLSYIHQLLAIIGIELERIEFNEGWEIYPQIVNSDEQVHVIKRNLYELAEVLSNASQLFQIQHEIHTLNTTEIKAAIADLSYVLQQKAIPFILYVDRRMAVADFNTMLSDHIVKRFNIHPHLPETQGFSPRAIIIHKGVLQKFEQSLKQDQLSLRLVELGFNYALFLLVCSDIDLPVMEKKMMQLAEVKLSKLSPNFYG